MAFPRRKNGCVFCCDSRFRIDATGEGKDKRYSVYDTWASPSRIIASGFVTIPKAVRYCEGIVNPSTLAKPDLRNQFSRTKREPSEETEFLYAVN